MDVQQILKEEHEKALAKRQSVADDFGELYEDFRQFMRAVDLSDSETLAALCFVIFAFADGYSMVVQAGETSPEQAEPLLRQTVADELEQMLSELKESAAAEEVLLAVQRLGMLIVEWINQVGEDGLPIEVGREFFAMLATEFNGALVRLITPDSPLPFLFTLGQNRINKFRWN
jgi:hypothetical protein